MIDVGVVLLWFTISVSVLLVTTPKRSSHPTMYQPVVASYQTRQYSEAWAEIHDILAVYPLVAEIYPRRPAYPTRPNPTMRELH